MIEEIQLKDEAIKAFVRDFPSSVITELLIHFDKKTVVEFISVYSGRVISIPSINSIWISYRNRVIKETLSKENSKATRLMLAERFGLLPEDVSRIYSHCVRRGVTRVRSRSLKRLVMVIIEKNYRKYQKELNELEGDSNDPEILYIIKELQQEFVGRCLEDIREYLLFYGTFKQHQWEKAIKFLIERVEELI